MNRLFLLLVLVPSASFAENPFQCVDPDITDAFLGCGHHSPPVYSTLMPTGFVKTRLPSQFRLVGSQSGEFAVTVVYKTTLDAAAALAESLDAFLKDGWRDVSSGRASHRRGFQTHTIPAATTICHDAKPGIMNIVATERSGRTFVTLALYSHQQAQSCSDIEATATAVGHRIALMDDLPTLELPKGATSSGSGGGGSGDEYSSRVVVSSAMSREELLRFFGDQIQNQEWRFDTSWSGSLSSGSVWSKKKSEDKTLIGTLKVVEASDGVFNIRFGLSPIDPNAGSWNVGFSIGSN